MKLVTRNIKNQNKIINRTVNVLQNGGLIIFPTDTVYGLLCDATNEQAVKKLIQFKNRPAGKAISVFSNFNLVNQLVKISNQQITILKQFLPGPFTIVLPSKHNVNKLLESETGALGIRIPMYRYIEVLTNSFKKPITATSANLAGRSPHYSVESLLSELTGKQKELIDLVINAGTLPRNKPSTVVDLSKNDVRILRQGDIDFSNQSEKFLSKTVEETKNIAKKILNQNINNKNKPLIFIIEGEMGAGKTVFVKGIGEQFGINNIISPTYVIYYEYEIKKSKKLIHIDLYNIEDRQEFKHLGLEKYLLPGNILCFEWGEKVGEIINILKGRGQLVYVQMKYVDEKTREIIVNKQINQ